MVGLSTTRVKTYRKGDKKFYEYQISHGDLVLVEEILKRRKDPNSPRQSGAGDTIGGSSPSQLQELVAAAVANAKKEREAKDRKKKSQKALISYDGEPDGGGDKSAPTSIIDHTREGVAVD